MIYVTGDTHIPLDIEKLDQSIYVVCKAFKQ